MVYAEAEGRAVGALEELALSKQRVVAHAQACCRTVVAGSLGLKVSNRLALVDHF
jgi:hypothetical protein